MFDATVINYLESKGISCSPALRAKHGLTVYVEFKESHLPTDALLLGQKKYVLNAETYQEYKKLGYLKD